VQTIIIPDALICFPRDHHLIPYILVHLPVIIDQWFCQVDKTFLQ
jgi:hypothetical protein